MNFDEAEEKLRKAVPDNFTKPTMHDIAVMLETQMKVIESLREEYAPTVEMKPHQFDVFKKYRYGVRKGDIDFGGIWSDKPYRMMQYFKDEPYTGTTIWDDSFAKAWLHPETIKVIEDEKQ